MTAETLKPFLTLPTNNNGPFDKRSKVKNIRLATFAIFVVLFCATIAAFEIWNSLQTNELRQEVVQLRKSLDHLKKHLGLEFFDDLADFENSYDNLDSVSKDTKPDYADTYANTDDDEEMGSADYDDDEYYDLESDETDKEISEDDSIIRKSRSLASVHGVPIVEEPYAMRKNQSESQEHALHNTMPKIRFDWDEKSDTPSSHLRSRFPKKYQAQRAAPTEYVSPPPTHDKAANQYGNQHHHVQQERRYNPNQIAYGRKRHVNPMHKNLEGRGRVSPSRSKSIAVHYSGDTTRYIAGRHEHYEGNGRIRHVGGVYADWLPSAWVNNLAMERFFQMNNGVVTARDSGLYYVYAQIFYHDDHDTNGFLVQHNGQSLLQCTTMTHSALRVTKSNTCFTAGMAYLKQGDTIQLTDLGTHRFTLFEPEKSFFGLIKMADSRPLQHDVAV